MKPFRHLLLVLALVFAQVAAGAHAIGHVAGDDGGLPGHACELCLAGHNLGAALPGAALLPPPAPALAAPEASLVTGRSHLPAPRARQGAPPQVLL